MGRLKSALPKIEIETVKRAHDCRHNGTHRLTKGEKRLLIKEGRKKSRYCLECATRIVRRDIKRLEELEQKIAAMNEP